MFFHGWVTCGTNQALLAGRALALHFDALGPRPSHDLELGEIEHLRTGKPRLEGMSLPRKCGYVGPLLYMSLVVRKPVFGVSDQVPHKPGRWPEA